MKLIINNQEVNFSLDQEKTLPDLIRSLEKWVIGQGWTMSGAWINGKDLYQMDDWENFELISVETLEIEALMPQEKLKMDLEMVRDFFALMIRASEAYEKGTDKKALWNLTKPYSDLKDPLIALLDLPAGNIDDPILLMELLSSQNPNNITAIIQLAQNCIFSAEMKLKRITENSPAKNLKALENLLPLLNQVSLLWQTGKPDEAMDIIGNLMDVLSKMSEWSSQPQIQGILIQIQEALLQKDLILTGDLLEYELSPLIQDYLDQNSMSD